MVIAADLYSLSEPCRLGVCDAFLSHSWHDNGEAKWKAVSAWCTAFAVARGRPSRLWFDKVCINQADIQADLPCLPIFLAGCNTLLVTCGDTYTCRLWCCVELFVYMRMSESLGHDIDVCLLAESRNERQTIVESWRNFDFRACECFDEGDKRRILDCFERNGGADGFNAYIRHLTGAVIPSLRRQLCLGSLAQHG
eukprot:TRINITY_DN37176_c0_g6_i1.p1 TRINITY_DN37176_c0_g6~~TRINITY_DN37176_c0_g6_i1.p1  ORF type:complete len:196 (-),score=16.62 TRINITY_DN37176_c0_g6_i1:55-642(-)